MLLVAFALIKLKLMLAYLQQMTCEPACELLCRVHSSFGLIQIEVGSRLIVPSEGTVPLRYDHLVQKKCELCGRREEEYSVCEEA